MAHDLSRFWSEISNQDTPADSLDAYLRAARVTLSFDAALVFSVYGMPPRARVEALDGVDIGPADRMLASKSLLRYMEAGANPATPCCYVLSGDTMPEELSQLSMVQGILFLHRRDNQVSTIVLMVRSGAAPLDESDTTMLTLLTLVAVGVGGHRLRTRNRDLLMRLRASERRYHQLLDETHDAVWVVDLDGVVLSANATLSNLVGKHIRYIIGQPEDAFIHPDDLQSVRANRELALSKGLLYDTDIRVRNERSGKHSTLKVSTSPVVREARVAGLQHAGKDVTRERRTVEHLRAYLLAITKAQEEERLRISRDLHDSTAQTLVALLNRLETHLRQNRGLPLTSSRFFWGIREDIKGVLQEVRHFARRLRPSILDDLGLMPAIEWLMEEHKKNHRINTRITVSGQMRRFPGETETAIFRMVQEALNNVVRHSGATSVTAEFENTPGGITIRLRDNGKGFQFTNAEDLLRSGKMGLAGITERANLIGGHVSIESNSGRGTCLTITLPA